jgi:hypothetical protein
MRWIVLIVVMFLLAGCSVSRSSRSEIDRSGEKSQEMPEFKFESMEFTLENLEIVRETIIEEPAESVIINLIGECVDTVEKVWLIALMDTFMLQLKDVEFAESLLKSYEEMDDSLKKRYEIDYDRAREASLLANMYTLQLAVEDYAILHEGNYPADTYDVFSLLPSTFANPFDRDTAYCTGKPPDSCIEGAVYYEHGEYGFSPYTIYGCGKDGRVLSLTLHEVLLWQGEGIKSSY